MSPLLNYPSEEDFESVEESGMTDLHIDVDKSLCMRIFLPTVVYQTYIRRRALETL